MDQIGMFGQAPPAVQHEPPTSDDVQVAASLPVDVRLGTSSWSFEGWSGILWRGTPSQALLAKEGLPAYSANPLFRAVGVDRTFYKPVDTETAKQWAQQVPQDFRFLVKAHDHVTTARFPKHPRFGRRAGQLSEQFLDAEYATQVVIDPIRRGLGERLGVILFQFPPHDPRDLGETPRAFAIRLYRFLKALPPDVPVAVEIRNEWALGPDYAGALRESGTSHCFNVQTGMPSIPVQRQVVGNHSPQCIVRWLLPVGMRYADAREQFAPFNALAAPAPDIRQVIAQLIAQAVDDGKPALGIVNNKAEGCSPLSVRALAHRLVRDDLPAAK